MKNRLPWFANCIPILIILHASCNSLTDKEDSPADLRINNSNEAIKVKTAAAKYKVFNSLINVTGKVRAFQEQAVNAEVSGKLELKINNNKDRFAFGELMAYIDSKLTYFKLERGKLNEFNSEKEYESNLLSYDNLLKDKGEAEKELIKKKLQISSGLLSNRLDIDEANYELERSHIRAPYFSQVVDLKVQNDQMVKPGQELFKIYNPYNLYLDILVLESDFPLLKKGQEVNISPVVNEEVKYKGMLIEINPYVNEDGMIKAKVKIDEKQLVDRKLIPGMNCNATISIPFNKAIVIPNEAVVMREGKAVVFTLENNKAKWQYVVPGRENGKEVMIQKGLSNGMKVIITNNLQLANDTPVKEENGE
jgi:RND family efflux transporter MFP subunit